MAKGLVPGLALSAVDTYVFRGNAPWTLNHHKPDHEATKPAKECKPIEYPAPDGKLSFNLLENVARSGTNHGHDQLCHLTLKDSTVPEKINLPGNAPLTIITKLMMMKGAVMADMTVVALNCTQCMLRPRVGIALREYTSM
jgi:hypothetical protein